MSVHPVQLGDVCEFVRGVTFDKAEVTTKPEVGKVPILRAGNIGEELDVQNDLVWVPARVVGSEQLLRRNDIAICMSSGSPAVVGKTARAASNLHASVGSFCGIIRPKNADQAAYLSFFFRSPTFFKHRDAIARGANIQNLRFSQFEEILLEIPAKQARIAGELEQADRLRRTIRYALELSDAFLPAAFLECFGDPVKNTRNMQHTPLEEELERIESGFSPVCDGPRQHPHQWAVLGLGAVTSGVFKPEENKRLPPDIPVRMDLEVQDGDVLVTRKNTYDLVAACAYVRTPPPRLLLPDTIFRFRLKERSCLTPVYLWGLLSFPSFKKSVQRLASGSAGSMPGISKEKFMSVRCPVPSSAQQQRFSALASNYERMHASQREALRQANHLFQSLLQEVFASNR